jgi:IMP dehydrogenase
LQKEIFNFRKDTNMVRAYDIMTRAVATVTPKTPVVDVARMMRDLNIGDVLVVDDGQLRGIVTDRDLTLQVLTNGANSKSPVEPYMTTNVVTGQPDWSLDQVADVMGKHQVRRLPIVQDGNVVGIVSLGDVALHTPKRETVAHSLKNISEATRTRIRYASPSAKVLLVAVPVALAVGAILFSRTNSGQQVRKQIEASRLPERARAIWMDSVHSLQDPHTRQAAVQALESTGIPERARAVVNDTVGALRDPHTRERAIEFVDATGHQVRQLPEYVTELVPQSNPKRFWII